jgi:type II secretory pathway component GspD/PulD (secretin)
VLPAEDGDRRHERTVCRLKSVPAVDAATTINQLLRAEGQTVKGAKERSVVIVPDPVSNSLLIGGPPDAIDEVRQLIEQIDRPAAMIALEVTIAEAPIEEKFSHDEKPEHMEVLSYARLTTLDNQPAFLKIERREAMISGTSVTPMGQANSVRYENLGTVVGVTPRVWPDDVVTMEIDVDDSRLGPVGEGTIISAPKEGEPVRTPNIDAMTSQSTIRIRDGQTAIMGGMSRQAKLGKQRLVLITPHVLRTDGNPKAPH